MFVSIASGCNILAAPISSLGLPYPLSNYARRLDMRLWTAYDPTTENLTMTLTLFETKLSDSSRAEDERSCQNLQDIFKI